MNTKNILLSASALLLSLSAYAERQVHIIDSPNLHCADTLVVYSPQAPVLQRGIQRSSFCTAGPGIGRIGKAILICRLSAIGSDSESSVLTAFMTAGISTRPMKLRCTGGISSGKNSGLSLKESTVFHQRLPSLTDCQWVDMGQ